MAENNPKQEQSSVEDPFKRNLLIVTTASFLGGCASQVDRKFQALQTKFRMLIGPLMKRRVKLPPEIAIDKPDITKEKALKLLRVCLLKVCDKIHLLIEDLDYRTVKDLNEALYSIITISDNDWDETTGEILIQKFLFIEEKLKENNISDLEEEIILLTDTIFNFNTRFMKKL